MDDNDWDAGGGAGEGAAGGANGGENMSIVYPLPTTNTVPPGRGRGIFSNVSSSTPMRTTFGRGWSPVRRRSPEPRRRSVDPPIAEERREVLSPSPPLQPRREQRRSSSDRSDRNRDERLMDMMERTIRVQESLTALTLQQQAGSRPLVPGGLALIRPFEGGKQGPTVENFLKSIAEAGAMLGWSEDHQMAVAKLKCTGSAYTQIQYNSNIQDARDWYALCQAFIDAFQDRVPIFFHQQELATSRQRVGETAREFANRLRILGLKTIPNTPLPVERQVYRRVLDQNLLMYYIAGLRDGIRRFVQHSNPLTFEEAVSTAEREEFNDRLTSTLQRPIRAVNAVQERPRYRGEPNGAPYNQGRPRAGYNPGGRPNQGEMRCYGCNEMGHGRWECPTPFKNMTCYFCDQKGHIQYYCPNNTIVGPGYTPKNGPGPAAQEGGREQIRTEENWDEEPQ
jgi:hypothetical protein